MRLMTVGDRFQLDEDVIIHEFTIPKGYITDFASIPRWAMPVLGSPTREKYRRASLLHDYLLDHSFLEKARIHRLFFMLLIEDGVSVTGALIMYLAVKFHCRSKVCQKQSDLKDNP